MHRPSLVPGWRQAYRWLSVQVALLVAIIGTVEASWPDLAALLPDGWARWGAVAVIVARIIRQQERGA